MEAPNSLKRRVAALEAAAPDDGCRTCAARPVFTMAVNGSEIAACPECGREPHTFTIDIDRASPRPLDAA
jgi:hypothetical protein